MSSCRINVTAIVETGGQKIGHYGTTQMTGVESKMFTQFTVDLQAPTHCLLQTGLQYLKCNNE